MISVLIVDDEALARAKLRRLLAEVRDVRVVAEAASAEQAVAAIRASRPNLVLLDIDLPDRSGFDVLAAFPNGDAPLIVFATAYDEFAVKAFEVRALDYLLKPFDAERLQAALARVRERLATASKPSPAALAALLEEIRTHRATLERVLRERRGFPERLVVRQGQEHVMLRVEDIDWVTAADNYVEVRARGATHLLRETLSSVEQRLDPARFVRVHRRAIVNLDRVRAIRQQVSGDLQVELDGGASFAVGRSYRPRVTARWQDGAPNPD